MRAAAWFACALAAMLALAAPAGAATQFDINGGGFGHGIGMSQYGAYGYALHGESYQFILDHYYQGTQLGTTDPNQIVTVLLANGAASFTAATKVGNKTLSPTVTYSVKALSDGSLAVYPPSGAEVGTFAAPLTVTGPGPLEVVGHGSYRGSLEYRPSGKGSGVETINAVDLEDYIRGVVGAEMPSSWAPQALEAQAVAARTYAITTNVLGNGFQQYSDTRSQMYLGIAAETPSTNAAVAATRGQVVTYNGAPVATFFFSSSGGYTESVQNVWFGVTPEAWLIGVPDPYDNAGGNPYHRWSYKMSTASAAAKLGKLLRGKLVGIKVTAHGVSPRIVTAEVVGTKGVTHVTGPQLESIFGLPSTYASFTTISSMPSTGGVVPTPQLWRSLFEPAGTAVHPIFVTVPPTLHGTIFPARPGARIAVQVHRRGGWRTVAHSRLSRGGSYTIALRRAGSYRIVYRGVRGPAVRAG